MDEPTEFNDLLTCALWSSIVSHDDDRCPGHPADEHFDESALSPEVRAELLADYLDFKTANAEAIERSGLSLAQVAHDFWLTRERHGAGFWDRGLGAIGDELTAAAHVYGEFDLQLWLDGECDD